MLFICPSLSRNPARLQDVLALQRIFSALDLACRELETGPGRLHIMRTVLEKARAHLCAQVRGSPWDSGQAGDLENSPSQVKVGCWHSQGCRSAAS